MTIIYFQTVAIRHESSTSKILSVRAEVSAFPSRTLFQDISGEERPVTENAESLDVVVILRNWYSFDFLCVSF